MKLKKIAIVGVGLIGGSLGLALKKNGYEGLVSGYGRRMSTLNAALELGAIDTASLDIAEAGHADMVVICTPVQIIPRMVELIAPRADVGCVITDVGSVKRHVVAESEKIIEASDSPARFVGSHPMAGSEKSGVLASRADLYEGAKCIVTPTLNSDSSAVELVKGLWSFVGADVIEMSTERHDHLIAAASHIPHLSASALAETTARAEGALEMTASGFKDSTRIASGSPSLWREILTQNEDMICPMIDALIESLLEYKRLLSTGNGDGLERKLEIAKRIRDSVN